MAWALKEGDIRRAGTSWGEGFGGAGTARPGSGTPKGADVAFVYDETIKHLDVAAVGDWA